MISAGTLPSQLYFRKVADQRRGSGDHKKLQSRYAEEGRCPNNCKARWAPDQSFSRRLLVQVRNIRCRSILTRCGNGRPSRLSGQPSGWGVLRRLNYQGPEVTRFYVRTPSAGLIPASSFSIREMRRSLSRRRIKAAYSASATLVGIEVIHVIRPI